MKLRTTTLLLTLGLCATAVAAPDQKRSDQAPPTADDVHVTVTASRGRLGVAVIEIGEELRTHFGAPADRGVLVDRVRPDSPAARAGLQVGDVVVDIDGDAARSATDMLDAMSDRKKGEQVSLDVIRDGKHMQLTATLDDNPGPRWQTFSGSLDKLDKMMPGTFGWKFGSTEKGFPKDFRWLFEGPKAAADSDLEKQLDDARKRIEQLEERLDRIDHT
jgi:membrane-associated protease RseP (regulator of RpoE activity)